MPKRGRENDDEGHKEKSASPPPLKREASVPAATPSRSQKREAHVEPGTGAKRAKLTSEPREFHPVDHLSINKVPGDIFVFGDGDCGQLGLGEDVTEKLRPALLVIDGKKALQVCAGGMHSVALLEDNTVWSWGVNDEGALGRYTAGKLWEETATEEEKSGSEPQDPYTPGRVDFPAGTPKIVQISAGDSHTAFLTEHGSIYICGTFRDSSGVMGFTPDVRIALRPRHYFELPRSARDRFCRIVSGADHVLALSEHGHVYSWGCGQQGQLGRLGERIPERSALQSQLHPAEVTAAKRGSHTKVVDVACGTYSSFFVFSDGHVSACGLNNYGQLGLEVGEESNMIQTPTVVPGLEKVAKVAGGQHHTLALTQDGHVVSFGRPTYGRLGRKDVDSNADAALPSPLAVEGLEEATAGVAGVAAGLAVSGCFGAGEGRCWVWGFGSNNQLGNGDDDDDYSLPERIKETKAFNLKKTVQLEFGGQHTLLLAVPRETEGAGAGQA